jgi:thiol-disulfide isomerase/thioredoxin
MSYTIEYFGAPWCKVCVDVKPVLKTLAAAVGVLFIEYNIDELEGDAKVAEINKLPTVRIFKDGALVETIVTKHVDSVKATLAQVSKVVLTEDF